MERGIVGPIDVCKSMRLRFPVPHRYLATLFTSEIAEQSGAPREGRDMRPEGITL